MFSAPTQTGCHDLDRTKSLTELVGYEASQLLEEYVDVSTTELLYHVVIFLVNIYFLHYLLHVLQAQYATHG